MLKLKQQKTKNYKPHFTRRISQSNSIQHLQPQWTESHTQPQNTTQNETQQFF